MFRLFSHHGDNGAAPDAPEAPRDELLSDAFIYARVGRPPVQDEFTDLRLPPYKKTRLRRKRDGRCVSCGRERPCRRHSRAHREQKRRLAALHANRRAPVRTFEQWYPGKTS